MNLYYQFIDRHRRQQFCLKPEVMDNLPNLDLLTITSGEKHFGNECQEPEDDLEKPGADLQKLGADDLPDLHHRKLKFGEKHPGEEFQKVIQDGTYIDWVIKRMDHRDRPGRKLFLRYIEILLDREAWL